jgi:quercetin dioxygenase-like cupin family protein
MAGTFKAAAERAREAHDTGFVAPAVQPADGGQRIVAVEAGFDANGGSHPFHTHPGQEEVIWVLEGRIEQWIEQERRELGPGDVAVVPADAVHGTYNTGDVPARILAILSPPVGESGYSAVDVSGEEPWASLRG